MSAHYMEFNMEQTVLKQVAGPEQPQEEVQLTELLPVKQSHIKENVLKDADTTDALRALRSLSSDCNDKSEDFGLSDFDFGKNDKDSKDDERQTELQSGKHRRGRRKRTSEDKNDIENADERKKNGKAEGKNAKRARTDETDESSRKDMKSGTKKSVKSNKKPEEGKKKKTARPKKNPKIEIPLDDDELAPEENDEEDHLYKDLIKEDYFRDVIYDYRPLEACLNSVTEKPEPKTKKRSRSNKTAGQKGSSAKKLAVNNDARTRQKVARLDGTTQEANSEEDPGGSKDEATSKDLNRDNNNIRQYEPINTSDSSEDDVNLTPKELRNKQRLKSLRLPNWQKKYSCAVCFTRFKGSGGLRNHYKAVHGDGPAFKCDDCGKEFPLKERLKLHMRTHTGFKPYKCTECDKTFARGGQLVQHIRTHFQIKPFRCKLCSHSFTCAANLTLHMKRHLGQRDHKCELCGRAFVRRDALKKHLECLHRDVKSFVCVICNKTFKGHLPQHMRTHAHDRPYGCATCGQRFAQKSQLTVHQRTHSGQRPFRCLVCWQAFAHSTALKLHTRRHTGERPFKCSECNAGFTQLPHWKKHMKCIHGRSEPYGCTWCDSFFRIKTELENHVKTSHPEKDRDDSDAAGSQSGADDEDADRSANGEITEKPSVTVKHKMMTVEKMRLLLAVLLKRISKKDKLAELGFGKRLIDDVLLESLVSAGKAPASNDGLSELEVLTRNLGIFLEWTMPKEHWEHFRKLNKTPQEILEALTDT